MVQLIVIIHDLKVSSNTPTTWLLFGYTKKKRTMCVCVINLRAEGRSELLSFSTCSTSEENTVFPKAKWNTVIVPPIWISPFVRCIWGSLAAGEERDSSLSVRQRRCSSATVTVSRALCLYTHNHRLIETRAESLRYPTAHHCSRRARNS